MGHSEEKGCHDKYKEKTFHPAGPFKFQCLPVVLEFLVIDAASGCRTIAACLFRLEAREWFSAVEARRGFSAVGAR